LPNLEPNPSDFVPPDLLVLTERQAARVLGISMETLKRLRQSGEGPKILQLSARRIGYRRAGLEAWLIEREAEQ
jgi:predicted DNA-binding transcriptional regulator AlpA